MTFLKALVPSQRDSIDTDEIDPEINDDSEYMSMTMPSGRTVRVPKELLATYRLMPVTDPSGWVTAPSPPPPSGWASAGTLEDYKLYTGGGITIESNHFESPKTAMEMEMEHKHRVMLAKRAERVAANKEFMDRMRELLKRDKT